MNVTKSCSGKIEGKNGVICLVPMFACRVIVLKLTKKEYFLQFCADLNKTPNSVKAIHEILAIKISKKMLTQQKFNIIF